MSNIIQKLIELSNSPTPWVKSDILRIDETLHEAVAEIGMLRSDLEAMEMKRNAASVSLMATIAENEKLTSEIVALRAEIEMLRENA